MRLIIFGDSFAHPHKADYVWTNNITVRLNATEQTIMPTMEHQLNTVYIN